MSGDMSAEGPSNNPTKSKLSQPQGQQEDVTGWWPSLGSGGEPKGLVKLMVGRTGQETRTLSCDKRTLASQSVFFSRKIVRRMNSSLPEWIILREEDAEAVEVIIEFVNNKTFPSNLPWELIVRVLETAIKFEMKQVVMHLRGHIKDNMKGISAAVDILELAKRLDDREFYSLALGYLVPRFSGLIESRAFLSLTQSNICALLKSPTAIIASEHLVFDAVIRWAESECQKANINSKNFQQFQSLVGDIVSLIRFPAMKPAYFREKVLPTGLVQRPDCELLEYYWELLGKDPVAAELMSLPFIKSGRTGKMYSVEFYPPKMSMKRLHVPAGEWIGIKLRAECSITLHGILVYGRPEQGIGLTHAKTVMLESVGTKPKAKYRTIKVQDATIRVTSDSCTSRLILDSPVTLSAGLKYKFRVYFLNMGLRASSHGTKEGSGWTTATVLCGTAGEIRLLAKKLEGGDLLFRSIEFTLARSFEPENDTFCLKRADIGVTNRLSQKLCTIV